MGQRFRRVDREQLFLLPPDVREWLPAAHPARFLVEVIAQLDLSAFVAENRSTADRGRPAYHPSVMVGIVLYASMCSITSSRAMGRLLATDVGFRVVAANEQPDHATISRFLVRYGPHLDGLFAQIVGLAAEAGLIDPTLVALDGTKMAASASKERNVSAAKLRAKYRDWLAATEANDATEADSDDGPISEMGDLDRMRAWITERLADLDDTPDEVRVNETDPDSTLLPRSGGGWVQGYNAQAAATAGGYVVAADVCANPNDNTMLGSMCDQIAERVGDACGETAGVVVADAGYWASDLIEDIAADDRLPDVLIATGRRTPKTPPEPLHEPDLDAHHHDLAVFDRDVEHEWRRRVAVIAQIVAGELLIREGAQQLGLSVPTTGELKLRYQHHGPDAIRPQHLPGRRRPQPPAGPTRASRARHHMDTRLASPAGRSMYRQRQAIIEPVFGDIKTNRRITRFLRRGIDKARTDWQLILTGHNLTLIHLNTT